MLCIYIAKYFLIFQPQTTNQSGFLHAWIATIVIFTLITLALGYKIWKQRQNIEKLKNELRDRNQAPAEQDHEDRQTVMYENTQPSVTFCPNPYYGDNEEEGNNIAFSSNPYYGTGEEEEYGNITAFSPNPYYGSGN